MQGEEETAIESYKLFISHHKHHGEMKTYRDRIRLLNIKCAFLRFICTFRKEGLEVKIYVNW